MRKIEKLSLTKLSKNELEARQMNALKGGGPNDSTCNCSCSSSIAMNDTRDANSKYGYQYSYGGDGTYTGTTTCRCENSAIMDLSSLRGNY